jgi:hypothetical protein
MKQKKRILLCCLLLVLAGIGILSCSKMDDYKKVLQGEEIVYTGKIDSLKLYPGRNRIKLSWYLLYDPKVTKCKVFWNDRHDSTVLPIQRSPGTDTIHLMLNNMPEATYTFEFITYDNSQHSSMVVDTIANVYGDKYQQSIYNRQVRTTKMLTNDTAMVIWYGINTQHIGANLNYTDKSGVLQTVFVPQKTDTLKLLNYKKGESFQYNSWFKPEKNALDTFYTQSVSQPVL